MKDWKSFTSVVFLITVALSVLSLTSCDITLPEKKPEAFTIKNNTGDSISSLYLREPGSLIWGTAVLSYMGLSNGNSRSVTIPKDRMDNQYRTDIQLRTSNGIFYTKLSQTLTHEGTVTFTSRDLDSTSPRTITIGNTTGDSISSLYLREPGSLIWGTAALSYMGLSNGGSRSVIIPNDRMDNQYRTDIQLRTSDGNLYTKLSQEITHNGTVTFTSRDLDSGSSRTITIGNVTGDSISSLYLREPESLIWGTAVLSYMGLSNGGSRSVTIPNDRMDNQYRTDIQLRTSDGNLYTKLSQEITHNGTVTFTSSDLDSISPRTITIGNVTGDSISSLYLREPGSLSWGTAVLSYMGLSNGGSRSVTIPYDRMDNQYRTDIQLRTSTGVTYTKLSQPITHNGNVTFTNSDKN